MAKLVSELPAEVTTEVEIARLERDERDGVADLGLPLAETKQLTAALQAEMVPAQVIMVGERRRSRMTCGCVLASKGHYTAMFRSLFGDVPVRVRRLLSCSCQGSGAAKSFAALDLEAAASIHPTQRGGRLGGSAAHVRRYLHVRAACAAARRRVGRELVSYGT